MKTRDFTIDRIQFHLNENSHRNKYLCKYEVLYYNDFYDSWRQIGSCNLLREAKEIANDFIKYSK